VRRGAGPATRPWRERNCFELEGKRKAKGVTICAVMDRLGNWRGGDNSGGGRDRGKGKSGLKDSK